LIDGFAKIGEDLFPAQLAPIAPEQVKINDLIYRDLADIFFCLAIDIEMYL